MAEFKFPKSERLTNKKKFDKLFESGTTLKAFPLKLIYILEEPEVDSVVMQFAFTVPKRSFKKAVDRNFLKRRMKEAYRLNKPQLADNIDLQKKVIYGIIIYINREKMEYKEIEKAWAKLVRKLEQALDS